jgi:prepilin-type processing-associated H-X9-DG protein
MAEWVTGENLRPRTQPKRLVFETAQTLAKPHELDLFAQLCSDADPSTGKLAPFVKGENWLVGEFAYTLYNHVVPINGYSCTNNTLVQQGAWTAGSNHGSGANVLFMDGHVRFCSDSMTLPVWRAVGSRNGSEALSSHDL